MNDILTKKEVTQYLKCSLGMVDKLMNHIPYYKVGRSVKFKREDIVEYLEEKKVNQNFSYTTNHKHYNGLETYNILIIILN